MIVKLLQLCIHIYSAHIFIKIYIFIYLYLITAYYARYGSSSIRNQSMHDCLTCAFCGLFTKVQVLDIQHVPEEIDVQIDKMNVRTKLGYIIYPFHTKLLSPPTPTCIQVTVFVNGKCIDCQIGDCFTCDIDSIMSGRYL